MHENRLFFNGRFAYSFGQNGGGLSDEFDLINQLVKLFSKDNYVTLHKSFIDQTDDIYDLIFDITPRDNVDYLLKDNEKVATEHRS